MADSIDDLLANALDAALRSVAAGGFDNQMQSFLRGVDRYQRNILPVGAEHSGLTFITRPRLCLQSSNLRSDRRFAPLDGNPEDYRTSVPYMIRCLLDTRFCRENSQHPSPLVDIRNPFFTPLNNALTSMSGWPDRVIQTLTTDAGFHSEDQTFAVGHDNLSKTYDFTLGFKDPQYAIIRAIFFYWLTYIANVTKGTMLAYADDIDNQRLNYTVSIYHFTMDPSRKYITSTAKATGSFPVGDNIGQIHNFNEGELFIQAAGKFTIPFTVNRVEYNDYAIVMDFNRLAERYWSEINKEGEYIDLPSGTDIYKFIDDPAHFHKHTKSKEGWLRQLDLMNRMSKARGEPTGNSASSMDEYDRQVMTGVLQTGGFSNFSGRPYIDTSRGRMKLSLRVDKNGD